MTSQIRPLIEYLILTNNILVLIYEKCSRTGGFYYDLMIILVSGLLFGEPCMFKRCRRLCSDSRRVTAPYNIFLSNFTSRVMSGLVFVSVSLRRHRLLSGAPVFNHRRSSFSGRRCRTVEHSAAERHVGIVTLDNVLRPISSVIPSSHCSTRAVASSFRTL